MPPQEGQEDKYIKKRSIQHMKDLTFLRSVHHSNELTLDVVKEYIDVHYERIKKTCSLVEGLSGKCLELGSSPYFMSMILRDQFEMTLANFFDPNNRGGVIPVTILSEDSPWKTGYYNFNVEEDKFPFQDEQFDLVMFCEIIEHLQNNPAHTLHEIYRVLSPGGIVVLTTPNVARRDNIYNLIKGYNIYDNYSKYGPYGRHNREYTKWELIALLQYCGFEPQIVAIEDVYPSCVRQWHIKDGQNILIRAKKGKSNGVKPGLLY